MRSAAMKQDLAQEPVTLEMVPDFNRLAHIYRWMEWFSFGPFLSRCRFAFIGSLRHCRSALVLGDGDGRFAARLLQKNSHVKIDAVDASYAMLRELRKRAGAQGSRLHTHVSDARVFLAPRRDYDLVVTHFFLDCLTTEEVESLALREHSHTSEGAAWVVSEFAVPEGWYGRAVAQPLISLLYQAFGWITGLRIRRLPDHRFALARAGWTLEREQQWLGGLLVSEQWRRVPQRSGAGPRL